MPRIRVPEQDSQGTTTVEIFSRKFHLYPQGDTLNFLEWSPAVTQSVEYDHQGQTSSIKTVCGETENRRSSDNKPRLVVEGVITEDQIEQAKALKESDNLRVVSDVHKGNVFVKRLTITQNQDLITYVPSDGEEQLAFQFQLQLRVPE